MAVSTGAKVANYACGALAYVWFAVSWSLALVPGYFAWLLFALSDYEIPPEPKSQLVLAALALLTLGLLAWPFVYLWLYDRWQVRKGL